MRVALCSQGLKQSSICYSEDLAEQAEVSDKSFNWMRCITESLQNWL